MIKYTFGEIFSSGGATLCKNPSDQTVYFCIESGCLGFISFIFRAFFIQLAFFHSHFENLLAVLKLTFFFNFWGFLAKIE